MCKRKKKINGLGYGNSACLIVVLGGNRTVLWTSSDTDLTIHHQWLTVTSSVLMNNGEFKIIADYLKCWLEKNKPKIYVALNFNSGFCTRVKVQASPDSAHIPWETKTTRYGFTDKRRGLVLTLLIATFSSLWNKWKKSTKNVILQTICTVLF